MNFKGTGQFLKLDFFALNIKVQLEVTGLQFIHHVFTGSAHVRGNKEDIKLI